MKINTQYPVAHYNLNQIEICDPNDKMAKTLEPIVKALLWFWLFLTDKNRPSVLVCIYLWWYNIKAVPRQEYDYWLEAESNYKALLEENMALKLEIERREAAQAKQNDNTHALSHLHSQLEGTKQTLERMKGQYKRACLELGQNQSIISNSVAENNDLKATGACLLVANKMILGEAEELKTKIQSLESLLDEARQQMRDEQQIQKWLFLQAKEANGSLMAEIKKSAVILSDMRHELQDIHVCRDNIIREVYTQIGQLEIEKESLEAMLAKTQNDLGS